MYNEFQSGHTRRLSMRCPVRQPSTPGESLAESFLLHGPVPISGELRGWITEAANRSMNCFTNTWERIADRAGLPRCQIYMGSQHPRDTSRTVIKLQLCRQPFDGRSMLSFSGFWGAAAAAPAAASASVQPLAAPPTSVQITIPAYEVTVIDSQDRGADSGAGDAAGIE